MTPARSVSADVPTCHAYGEPAADIIPSGEQEIAGGSVLLTGTTGYLRGYVLREPLARRA
jgi:hypothetical protein